MNKKRKGVGPNVCMLIAVITDVISATKRKLVFMEAYVQVAMETYFRVELVKLDFGDLGD
jgi:hypothetical protein